MPVSGSSSEALTVSLTASPAMTSATSVLGLTTAASAVEVRLSVSTSASRKDTIFFICLSPP